MSRAVRLGSRAIDDLIEIRDWIARNANEDVALAYVARIEKRFESLRAFPFIGTARDDLVPGLRILSFERRIRIAYRIVGDDIRIERVISAARDDEAFR